MKPLDEVVTTRRTGWLGIRRGGSAVLAMLAFFAARFALESSGFGTAARIGIALAPLPFFAWMLVEFVQRVRSEDELERRIQLEALAVAFPLTLFLLMLLGLLQVAVPLPPEDWSYRHIWPFLVAFYIFGIYRARRRYE